ncbi:MAG: glucosamine-6-phosphate synthase, partial [Actinobacteria bacterium]|nr:glucosamine-6-phosphate synthase [Actinomycetota bacterium]
MCGIIAVVRRQSGRALPETAAVCDPLDRASRQLDALIVDGSALPDDTATLVADAAAAVQVTDLLLRGVPGVRALLEIPGLAARVSNLIDGIDLQVLAFEAVLDGDTSITGVELEQVNASLIELKDAVWAVRRDRLRAADGVTTLIGTGATPAAVAVGLSMHQALSALDRLEVRGRDSAGIHLLVRGHGIDLDSPALRAELATRHADPLFGSMALRTPEGHLSLVYKAAAEIGELGDNTRVLRDAIAGDQLLAQALASAEVEAVVLGHTRWASVGIISQPNAHPLNSDE